MTDINVVKKIQHLRRDLDMEVNLFHEQIELPLNEALKEDKEFSEQNNSAAIHLNSIKELPYLNGSEKLPHNSSQ